MKAKLKKVVYRKLKKIRIKRVQNRGRSMDMSMAKVASIIVRKSLPQSIVHIKRIIASSFTVFSLA